MRDFNKLFLNVYSNETIRTSILKATERALKKREAALEKIPDFESYRDQAREIRNRSIFDQEVLMDEFASNAERNGFIVHIAKDSEEARLIVLSILQKRGARSIIKGKSMVSEEIQLREFLRENGYEVYETDLGEFIIQLAGEKPSHLTGPAIHKNRFEIGRLLTEKLGIPYTSSPEKLTGHVRNFLRDKFFTADVGITGANFLIADTGGMILLENEGNVRLTTTLPGVHIAITGMEKIIPSLNDLAPILKILPPSSTGQIQTGYVNYITSGRERERHIILLDNGRSRMKEHPLIREALRCIRCGACANACPVFQLTGGHAYGGVYSGAMGIIWNTFIYGTKEMGNLPYMCTLCGACEEVCPVKIPLPDLILELRREHNRELLSPEEKILIRSWTLIHTSPIMGGVASIFAKLLKFIQRQKGKISKLPYPASKWTKNRDIKLR